MRLTLRVKPRSKRPSITQGKDGEFIVAVHEAPTDGKANEAVIKAIAKHFHVAPSRVRIVRGVTGRKKVVEVDGGGGEG